MEKQTIDNFDLRNFFKRWPSAYYFIGTVFGPMMFSGLSSKGFLSKYQIEGKTLNLGSGPRVLGSEVENVDIHPYPGVVIVADIAKVPLQNGSVSRIICDNVLEHVSDVNGAVKEIERLLASGGLVYVALPFIYPFHSSPYDRRRYTKQGLEELFSGFDIVESGVRAGPFSALTVYLNHLFAFIFSFGSARLASLLVNVVMFVTFPIKLLDIIFSYWPRADELAAVIYFVGRKK
jgi:SAM-dependent methyltransferase